MNKENARPWRFVCWLMVVTFLLAACGSPSAANEADASLDARALFSQEDAEALMGEPSLEADCTDAHVEGVATVSGASRYAS